MRSSALLLMTMTACAQMVPQTPTHTDHPLPTVKTLERAGSFAGLTGQES